MALFRDVQGKFFEISEDVLARCEVKKEAMDSMLQSKPVVGVQVPRPESQCVSSAGVGQTPGIVVYQFFGTPPSSVMQPGATLPSDIELAHYGTTIDNPKE